MDSLVYSVKFKVKGHDINSRKCITIPRLLLYLQEASLQHARQLNTSAWDMKDDQQTWVLIKKEVKIMTPLALDGVYTILTYPSGFDKFFAYRDYLVFDDNKKLVVGASSTWTLIQTESRKLLKIPEKIVQIEVPDNTRFLPHPEKLILPSSEMIAVDHRKVRPYDLDWNNHVNNIVLVRFIMESVKSQGIEDDEVLKIAIQFKNEMRMNESVNLTQVRDQNDIFTQLKNAETEQEIARSRITLKT